MDSTEDPAHVAKSMCRQSFPEVEESQIISLHDGSTLALHRNLLVLHSEMQRQGLRPARGSIVFGLHRICRDVITICCIPGTTSLISRGLDEVEDLLWPTRFFLVEEKTKFPESTRAGGKCLGRRSHESSPARRR